MYVCRDAAVNQRDAASPEVEPGRSWQRYWSKRHRQKPVGWRVKDEGEGEKEREREREREKEREREEELENTPWNLVVG